VLMVNLCLFILQFAILLYLYRPLPTPTVPLNESLLILTWNSQTSQGRKSHSKLSQRS
jgi:hypothetical protein